MTRAAHAVQWVRSLLFVVSIHGMMALMGPAFFWPRRGFLRKPGPGGPQVWKIRAMRASTPWICAWS